MCNGYEIKIGRSIGGREELNMQSGMSHDQKVSFMQFWIYGKFGRGKFVRDPRTPVTARSKPYID